ncbi:MAG: hypothetical protein ACXQT0_02670, partial [Candidatus Methanofastidiosia archaeon]
MLFYVLLALPGTYMHIHEVGSTDKEWRVSEVYEVAKAIEEISNENDSILTWWPGYTFASNRDVVRGLETGCFGYSISKHLSSQQLSEYHILSKEQITQIISKHEVNIVVCGADTPPEFVEVVK